MIDHKVLLSKAMKYCAYQERNTLEVKNKLSNWGATHSQIESILNQLKEEKFIDDLRYAEVYTRGKFRSNKWGFRKIELGLKQKQIAQELINEAQKQIHHEEYMDTLRYILHKKVVKAETEYQRKQKLATYALNKGFESHLIWQILGDIQGFEDL
ncbi:MAG: regulatory protein RecX [Hyphomicrobiales bacterium]